MIYNDKEEIESAGAWNSFSANLQCRLVLVQLRRLSFMGTFERCQLLLQAVPLCNHIIHFLH